MMVVNKRIICNWRHYSKALPSPVINGKTFEVDSYTNISPKIISFLNRNLFKQKEHPICFVKEKIVNFFYNRFKNTKGNPLFSVFDDLSPIVTTHQNFDSLLVPRSHPSRSKTDCYYINKEWLLRAHMTAHQTDLIRMGLNNFLMVGDVYRRDDINSKHYPVFHQLDGVRLLTPEEVFAAEDDGLGKLEIKRNENLERTEYWQEVYTEKATKMVEAELKRNLEDLTKDIFGKDIQYRWVNATFPFTHPSWELEIMLENDWVEVLGCGVVEHEILQSVGCSNRIGWAFGIGLERLAMIRYSIPDIRIFWSTDSGFLHQFKGKTFNDKVTFKPVSIYSPCPFDLSFWINDTFECQDFYELAREHCGDLIEQIELIDVYKNPKTGKESRCYRLVYRSMEKVLTKEEVRAVHDGLTENIYRGLGELILYENLSLFFGGNLLSKAIPWKYGMKDSRVTQHNSHHSFRLGTWPPFGNSILKANKISNA